MSKSTNGRPVRLSDFMDEATMAAAISDRPSDGRFECSFFRAGDGYDLDARLSQVPLTDLGNAERLIARHGRDLRYCAAWRKWLCWDGTRWRSDDGKALAMAARTVRSIFNEAGQADDKGRRRELTDWQAKSESRERIKAMLGLAPVLSGVSVDPAELNSHPSLFNCANGTLDLESGNLREHRREDLLTQVCPTKFDPKATAPNWLQTLAKFLPDDEVRSYFQVAMGLALSGTVAEHLMPICYGQGANGKSTILGAILDTIGKDYGMKAPPDLLMAKQHDAHPTERADLFGKRLVVAIETEAGRRLSEVLVKELTGGDSIRARRMREDYWEFKPTHSVVMGTNHRPVVRGTDRAIWRRLALIPFDVSVETEDQDTTMPIKLSKERPGILAWLVEGWEQYRDNGMPAQPEAVTKATSQYRETMDFVGTFIDQRCIVGPNLRHKASDFYKAYQEFAEASGEFVQPARAIQDRLAERGIKSKPMRGYPTLFGIALRGK